MPINSIGLVARQMTLRINGSPVSYRVLDKLSSIVEAGNYIKAVLVFDSLNLLNNLKGQRVRRVAMLSGLYFEEIRKVRQGIDRVLDFEGVIDQLIVGREAHKSLLIGMGFPPAKIRVWGVINVQHGQHAQGYEPQLKPQKNWTSLLELI